MMAGRRSKPDEQTWRVLYHWAPRSRRWSIKRFGLVPGSHSVQREWRPPYVCLSDDPILAWNLSGRLHDEIDEWDLWAVFELHIPHLEQIYDTYRDTNRPYVKEVRVYERIPKRVLNFIGTRQQREFM
jgi:hypothetical protein